MSGDPTDAVRATARGRVQGVGLRAATVARAGELGVLGWVRHGEPDEVLLHAEGDRDAVQALLEFLREGPAGSEVEALTEDSVKPEGHEQFAIRGVSAGRFELSEGGDGAGFALWLEVEGEMRGWLLPKGPSMDPATKRMAFEVTGSDPRPEAEAWDAGPYEQGGRVSWPEAIERGHAVFVLHGRRLEGGFALQRIRTGARPQWLLIKRRDELARRGSDVVAESRA